MMKQLIIALVCFLSFNLYGQDEKYNQVETIRLSPNPIHVKVLVENMRAHNLKYHATAPYTAAVFNVSTGPDAGKLVWMMGPCTFTDLDNRPSAGGHDEDWANNVVPYLNDATDAEYWRRDKDFLVNVQPDGTPPYPMYWVRYHSVTKGQGYRVQGILKKIHATVAELDSDLYWAAYDNQFRQGYENGRHIATVLGMNNWAEFDRDVEFPKVFNQVHGEKAFDTFVRETEDVFSNSWDEVWTLDTYMSGMPETAIEEKE